MIKIFSTLKISIPFFHTFLQNTKYFEEDNFCQCTLTFIIPTPTLYLYLSGLRTFFVVVIVETNQNKFPTLCDEYSECCTYIKNIHI